MKIKILKKEEMKRLIKPFLLFFFISFLIINWNKVYWLFSYRAVSGVLTEFFQSSQENVISEEEKKEAIFSEKNNTLGIPKLGIEIPIIFAKSSDEKEMGEALNRGAVVYPDSVLPGKIGQTIILGHSAPPNWPKIKYDWVFSNINELAEGDEIFVYFENQKYNYSVIKKIFLRQGEKIPEDLTSFDSVLILVSCWPPGKDYKRIAVESALKK